MWESTVDGRVLHFHLAGINNQNFIMRDEETGSWWQQVTGKAIHGTLEGHQVKSVFHDEITLAIWIREHLQGRVLKPGEAAGAGVPTAFIVPNDSISSDAIAQLLGRGGDK